MPAANGVIHMLEGILLPPTILPILPKHCSQEQHKIVVVSARRTAGPAETQCCLWRGHPRGWAGGGSGPATDPTDPPGLAHIPCCCSCL